ncbi:MAG: hypothetical protein ABTQ32_16100 [Myxococcaceae bacterium]
MRRVLFVLVLAACKTPLEPLTVSEQSLDLGSHLVFPGKTVTVEGEVTVTNPSTGSRALVFSVTPNDGALVAHLEGAQPLEAATSKRLLVRATLTSPGEKVWRLLVDGAELQVNAIGLAPPVCTASLKWVGRQFDSEVVLANEGTTDCFFGKPLAHGEVGGLLSPSELNRAVRPGQRVVVRTRVSANGAPPPATLIVPVLNDNSRVALALSSRCIEASRVQFDETKRGCAAAEKIFVLRNVCDVPLRVTATRGPGDVTLRGPLGAATLLSPSSELTFFATNDTTRTGWGFGSMRLEVTEREGLTWTEVIQFSPWTRPRVDDTLTFRTPPPIRYDALVSIAGGAAIEPGLAHLDRTFIAGSIGSPVQDLQFAVISADSTGGDFLSTDGGVHVIATPSSEWKQDLRMLLHRPLQSVGPSCIDSFLRALEPARLSGPNRGLLRDGVPLYLLCFTTQQDSTSLDGGAAFTALQNALGGRPFSFFSYGPNAWGTEGCQAQPTGSALFEDLARRSRGSALALCESVGTTGDPYRKEFFLATPNVEVSWIQVELDGVATPATMNGDLVWRFEKQRNSLIFEEYPVGKVITVRIVEPCP